MGFTLACLVVPLQNSMSPETSGPSWRRSLPHVVVATITSFLFGYHTGLVLVFELTVFSFFNLFFVSFWRMKYTIKVVPFLSFIFILVLYRVVNEPLESISVDLGFSGNTLAEGDLLPSFP